MSKLFYERLIKGGKITFFSPSDVEGLYDAFISDENKFEELYTKYENDPSIRQYSLPASEVFVTLMKERAETGRIYIQNIDHVNSHSPFEPTLAPIEQSNLCVAGDTMILTDKGNIKIADYENEFVNVWNGHEFSNVRIIKTGSNQELMSVTFSTRDVIKCTKYHKFYVQIDGEEVLKRAHELEPHDEIIDFTYPTGETYTGITVTSTGKVDGLHDTYCFNEPLRHKGVFNNILTGQCQEIALPTKPFVDVNTGDDGLISLCTLGALNWGNFEKPEDMKDACDVMVRALDALLDYQDYPIEHAKRSTDYYRPLGIGIINYAYFLAKRGLKYDAESLPLVNEWMEAYSYYLTSASVELAKEKGRCGKYENLRYRNGILPIDNYNKNVDQLVTNELKCDWDSLRKDIAQYGIRNATLIAMMPSECQKWSNKLSTAEYGDIDFHELCDLYNIDYEKYELSGIPESFHLLNPLKIETRNGIKEATRLYYNGNHVVYGITFTDGTKYSFTGNHQLLVKDGNSEIWVRVDELTLDSNIVTHIGITGVAIIDVEPISPTWDIEVPDGNEYILPNGVVSHNTSSQISNSTSGIDPVRSLVTIKTSKDGVLSQVVPEISKLKNKYDMLWDMVDMEGYLSHMAVLQKYTDQSISVNTSYDPENYDEGKLSLTKLLKDLIYAYKYGLKNLYYHNTKDNAEEVDVDKMSQVEQPSETEDETTDSTRMSVLEMFSPMDGEEDCDSCKI